MDTRDWINRFLKSQKFVQRQKTTTEQTLPEGSMVKIVHFIRNCKQIRVSKSITNENIIIWMKRRFWKICSGSNLLNQYEAKLSDILRLGMKNLR
ncbi:hypothetical protein HZS_2705 [Henneguya salminicola]|nr:hypothetical protein HZS_2705 [Henneguya salminicola]